MLKTLLFLMIVSTTLIAAPVKNEPYLNVFSWMQQNGHPKTSITDFVKIWKELKKYPNKKLLLAIMKVESNFYKKAISKKKAKGLMQIHPIHVKDLKKLRIIKREEDLYKISNNIKAGNYVLTLYKGNLFRYSGGSPSYKMKVLNALKELKDLKETNEKQ